MPLALLGLLGLLGGGLSARRDLSRDLGTLSSRRAYGTRTLGLRTLCRRGHSFRSLPQFRHRAVGVVCVCFHILYLIFDLFITLFARMVGIYSPKRARKATGISSRVAHDITYFAGLRSTCPTACVVGLARPLVCSFSLAPFFGAVGLPFCLTLPRCRFRATFTRAHYLPFRVHAVVGFLPDVSAFSRTRPLLLSRRGCRDGGGGYSGRCPRSPRVCRRRVGCRSGSTLPY